jgi:hypothetical protein
VAEISHIRFVKQKRETGIDRNRGFMWDLFGNVGCVDSGGATMIAALMSRARAFAVLLAIGVSVTPARAVDGTWTGGALPIVNEWTQGTNWNSTPSPNTVPDNTATFTSVATTVSHHLGQHIDQHDSVHRRGRRLSHLLLPPV